MKLAKAYEGLVNQRDDFLHKLSRFYVNNCDIICVEKLNIRNARNQNLARKILDAFWVNSFSYYTTRPRALVVW